MGLIPLPFHGQCSQECVDAVFADPAVLAETYPLGKNPNIYDEDEYKAHEAMAGAKSGLLSMNIAMCDLVLYAQMWLSGVTIANVGLVVSSGVHRRVSTDF